MNEQDKFRTGQGVPILVGITGHRDPEDETKLIKDTSAVLRDIAVKYPASPIVLLTPLGEGADRAAARAVLNLHQSEMDIVFITVLPMDEGEYTGTFSDSASVAEYYNLKSRGMGCFKIPVPDSLGDKDHEQLYANLGAFLAQHTQVLIAAWNGAEEAAGYACNFGPDICTADGGKCPQLPVKPGGTYHVLRMRFFGVEDDYRNAESYLANREYGPVYWIKTRRKSSGYLAEGESVSGPAYPQFPLAFVVQGPDCQRLVKSCFPDHLDSASNGRTFARILSKLDAYNLDISAKFGHLRDKIEKSKEEFYTSAVGNPVLPLSESGIVSHYSFSDCLSSYYQHKRRQDIFLLVLLAFLGLLSYSLYSGPLVSYLFILGYTFLYLAGCIFYLFKVKTDRHHEKYVDYRGIAEGLRIQFFWSLMGIEAKAADVYLIRHKGSVSWIKIAMNNVLLLAQALEDDPAGPTGNHLELVDQLWLQKQRDYYSRKYPQKHRADAGQKKQEAFLFVVGLAAAVLLAGADTFEAFAYGTSGVHIVFGLFASDSNYINIHQWLVFAVGFLPVIIASYKVFTELMAYAKLARNFKWMRLVYSTGLNEFARIRSCSNSDTEMLRKCRKLIYDIGVEALSETEEWIGILDDRVPELPK